MSGQNNRLALQTIKTPPLHRPPNIWLEISLKGSQLDAVWPQVIVDCYTEFKLNYLSLKNLKFYLIRVKDKVLENPPICLIWVLIFRIEFTSLAAHRLPSTEDEQKSAFSLLARTWVARKFKFVQKTRQIIIRHTSMFLFNQIKYFNIKFKAKMKKFGANCASHSSLPRHSLNAMHVVVKRKKIKIFKIHIFQFIFENSFKKQTI